MKNKLVIADIYRARNKNAFFAMHQATTILHEFDIEFHIIWDDPTFEDEWTAKINSHGFHLTSYTKKQLDEYCLNYGVSKQIVDRLPKYWPIYCIIHAHYLKTHNICDYYLVCNDDIVFKEDLVEFKVCLKNKQPCLVYEPLNAGCDKAMANTLFSLYENSVEYYKDVNPNIYGFNGGIQGVSLDMYDDFLEPRYFEYLLTLFDYSGIYDSDGKEIVGAQRSMIETQQQSFLGIMNIIRSKTRPVILDINNYFVCPNWGHHPLYGEINPVNEFDGWDVNMKSKIMHFIGHTMLEGVYYGKARVYYELIDKYFKKHNIR